VREFAQVFHIGAIIELVENDNLCINLIEDVTSNNASDSFQQINQERFLKKENNKKKKNNNKSYRSVSASNKAEERCRPQKIRK